MVQVVPYIELIVKMKKKGWNSDPAAPMSDQTGISAPAGR
jgi:hypothetical protein